MFRLSPRPRSRLASPCPCTSPDVLSRVAWAARIRGGFPGRLIGRYSSLCPWVASRSEPVGNWARSVSLWGIRTSPRAICSSCRTSGAVVNCDVLSCCPLATSVRPCLAAFTFPTRLFLFLERFGFCQFSSLLCPRSVCARNWCGVSQSPSVLRTYFWLWTELHLYDSVLGWLMAGWMGWAGMIRMNPLHIDPRRY